MAKQRLDKIISSMGSYSRKDVKQLIREKKICVNGNPILKPEDKFDPAESEIYIDGELFIYSENTYIMLNKPAGVISATEDGREKTVLDLISDPMKRNGLFPVGRLDKDTEGLLLITDDGKLAHELLSPVKHVEKEYFVRVSGILTNEDIQEFRNGILLSDGYHCRSAELQILSKTEESRENAVSETLEAPVSEALVIIREGKFHQIKRMFAALGKTVVYLKRIRMGTLRLDPELKPGELRLLQEEEIQALKQLRK